MHQNKVLNVCPIYFLDVSEELKSLFNRVAPPLFETVFIDQDGELIVPMPKLRGKQIRVPHTMINLIG